MKDKQLSGQPAYRRAAGKHVLLSFVGNRDPYPPAPRTSVRKEEASAEIAGSESTCEGGDMAPGSVLDSVYTREVI